MNSARKTKDHGGTRRDRAARDTRAGRGEAATTAPSRKARRAPADRAEERPALRGMARSFAVLEYLAASAGPRRRRDRGARPALGDRPPHHHPAREGAVPRSATRRPTATRSARGSGISARPISPITACSRRRRPTSASPGHGGDRRPDRRADRQLAVAIYSAQRLAEDITKAHYGYHFPLHCGSKGQVLLAYEDAGLHRQRISAATSSG